MLMDSIVKNKILRLVFSGLETLYSTINDNAVAVRPISVEIPLCWFEPIPTSSPKVFNILGEYVADFIHDTILTQKKLFLYQGILTVLAN